MTFHIEPIPEAFSAELHDAAQRQRHTEAERDEARAAARHIYKAGLGMIGEPARSIWGKNLIDNYPWLKEADG